MPASERSLCSSAVSTRVQKDENEGSFAREVDDVVHDEGDGSDEMRTSTSSSEDDMVCRPQ